ncbi:MAG: glycosyltransferase family 2 protein [Candidatus Sigynarchaeota archaeon]
MSALAAATVALTTIRKNPGFVAFCDSLVAQIDPTRHAIELIVVDAQLWYIENRREALADAVRGRLPFRHVEPKPTLWQGPHRLPSRDYWAASSARNTAILYAQKPRIIFVDDCQTVEDGWLAAHLDPTFSDSVLAGGRLFDDNGKDHRLENWGSAYPGTCSPGWTYSMNLGVPLEAALQVGGFDEKYDGQGGVEDCDFGIRLARAGWPIYFHPGALVCEHREIHDPIHGWGAGAVMKHRMLSDGKLHFANEFLIEELQRDSTRYRAVETPDLRELRARVQCGAPLPIPTSPIRDWRDDQLLKEM